MRIFRTILNLALIGFIVYMSTVFSARYSRLKAELSAVQSDRVDARSDGEWQEQERQALIAQSAKLADLKDEDQPPRDPNEIPSRTVEGLAGYKYLCYLPRNYGREDKKWPLIVFLHGQGAKGDSLQPLYVHNPIGTFLRLDDPNFMAVAPLCPANGGWQCDELHRFLMQFKTNYPIDNSRVYLTGISMGGHGTWQWIENYPKEFAAAAVLCGSGNPRLARSRLRRMPIWVFHGAKDDIVPVDCGLEMIHALESVGGSIKYTIFPDMGHNIGGIYDYKALYAWFLTNQKPAKNP